MSKVPKITLLFMMLAVLLGCQQNNHQQEMQQVFDEPQYEWGTVENKKLLIWGITPDLDRNYIQKACKRYEELTSNRLEIVQITKDEINERMQNALQGNEAMPDIFVSYGGINIDSFHPDENFYDFSEAEWVQDLTEASINQTVYHGKIIGLPFWEASISGTLYNKEIFEKYALKVPTTQAEFMDVCETLLAQGITPLYLPAKEISMLLYQFPLDTIVVENDILNALNEDEIGYADLPEMETVLKWYKTMADKGYLGENYLQNNWDNMSEALDSEKYAMLLCWDTWLYTDFKGDASKFGIMPAFIGTPENGTFEGPNLNLFMVNKKSENIDGALDFINFLADPYNYNVAFEDILTAPVFKNQIKSISTPQYLENERLIEQYYHDSIAWLRIRGFSQMDAKCIVELITLGSNMSIQECLRQMDELRRDRLH